MEALLYGMIYLGSALMAYNIYRYVKFARHIREKGSWDTERKAIAIPIILLALFLVGYLAVAFFGEPDLIIAGILLGGSIFVFVMIVFLQRVTDRIQENERLEAQLEAAKESSRAKTAFLSTMSHEIRTPMNAIIGLNTIALEDDELSPATRERLEKIGISARHLLGLINDILDMNRIESGKMALREEEFSLNNLLSQVNVIIDDQCSEKGLDYQHEIRGDISCLLIGDDTKLKQVLINILGNAVKFTDVPGRIRFSTRLEDREADDCSIQFIIEDTGIGMDEDFLPQLFSTFTQEDATSTNRYGGSGLGMAITKQIVTMMDGAIEVESEKGVGTTFTVSVMLKKGTPLSEVAAVSSPCDAASPTADGKAPTLEGLHVLLAEDIAINAEIVMNMLEVKGISIDHVVDGQAAVSAFAESAASSYDAVLMDVRMPVMDGLAATKAIRALDRPDAQAVPIIAMTANAFEDDVQRSLDAGMDAHLTKPVEPERLYRTLCRLTHEGGPQHMLES